MVQFAGQTNLDASPGDDWADLADSLSGHPCQFWVCVRADVSWSGQLAGGIALRHQSHGEPDFHTDSIWDEKSAAGCGRHFDCLDHNRLVRYCHLAALQMGCLCSGALLYLGFFGNGSAACDHGDELGKTLIRGAVQV